jgi:hypothetical protein
MDSALIPKGVKRCPMWQFLLGLGIVGAVLAWGVYAMLLCWFKGLNQTNMNDYYGFALWIWADLAVIALGGGAFFSGLLKYIIGKDELKHIINYAVLIGFICYSSALADPGHRHRPAPARMVHLLACQRPFHAHRGGLLPLVLFFGVDHRVHPPDPGKPPVGQGALLSTT